MPDTRRTVRKDRPPTGRQQRCAALGAVKASFDDSGGTPGTYGLPKRKRRCLTRPGAALCMAAAVRGGDVDGVIFHSDHGGAYVGDLFARGCRALGVTKSVRRVGSALDNAAAEASTRPSSRNSSPAGV